MKQYVGKINDYKLLFDVFKYKDRSNCKKRNLIEISCSNRSINRNIKKWMN